jgi:DNA-binding NtrC family response regulator
MSENLYPSFPVIIVEDEVEVSETEALALEMAGITNVIICNSAKQALEEFAKNPRGLALLDINMPFVSGLDLLELHRDQFPGIKAIMLTGLNDVQTAVRCLHNGALDYIVKPIDSTRLEASVRNALSFMEKENEALLLGNAVISGELRNPHAFAAMITADPHMYSIFQYLDALASTDLPILVTGETGTGKELVAAAVHTASRRTGSFVRVNTAGIDDTLFSDTLFGHLKGAFTSADKQRIGLVEQARGGTLFLDEIGDLRPESQIKLLRLLQEGTYYPLGCEIEQRSTARIVAATNLSISALQSSSSFRKDLFYRLKSHHVNLPPLRKRKADLPMLTKYFLEQAANEQGKRCPTVPQEFFTLLSTYSFPGNIRELRGIVYDAVSCHHGGILSCEAVRKAVGLDEHCYHQELASSPAEINFPEQLPTMEQTEVALIHEALHRAGGNKSIAATMIGVSRQTLRARLTSETASD